MKATSTFAGALLFVLALTGCDSPGVAPNQSPALSAPSQPLLSVKKDRAGKKALVSLRVGLSEQARQVVTNSEEMTRPIWPCKWHGATACKNDVGALLNLLSEELRFDGKGNDIAPNRLQFLAKQIVFLVDKDGDVVRRAEGKPFDLEVGPGSFGENFPAAGAFSLLEKALPHTKFALDSFLFPKDYALIHPDDQSFFEALFNTALKKDQVALVIDVIPAEKSRQGLARFSGPSGTGKTLARVRTLPMGVVLSPSR